ncbi:hypothetical protein ACFL2A_06205, partial [Thermodesulfobacteriota bacterium]
KSADLKNFVNKINEYEQYLDKLEKMGYQKDIIHILCEKNIKEDNFDSFLSINKIILSVLKDIDEISPFSMIDLKVKKLKDNSPMLFSDIDSKLLKEEESEYKNVFGDVEFTYEQKEELPPPEAAAEGEEGEEVTSEPTEPTEPVVEIVEKIEEHSEINVRIDLKKTDSDTKQEVIISAVEVERKLFYVSIRWKKDNKEVETIINKRLMLSSVFSGLISAYKYLKDYMECSFNISDKDNVDPDKITTVNDIDTLLKTIVSLGKKGYYIQRYKGLGEMNPDQLWETTMNPEKRTLVQVKVEDVYESDQIFSVLMGDQVEPRRNFIETNAMNVKNLDI